MTTATIFDQPISPAGQIIMDIYDVGIFASAGALAGLVLGVVAPAGGAIFGATFAVTHLVGRVLENCIPTEAVATKSALQVAKYILSTGLGIIATTYAGFTLTTLGACGLLFAMIPTIIFVAGTGACIGRCSNGMNQT